MTEKIKKFIEKFRQKINFRVLLDNKRFTISFSIIVSIILWLIITLNDNPVRSQVFNDISATVSIENTVISEMGLGIVNDISSQKFSVSLSGPNYIVSSLKPEDIMLNADITDVTKAGTYKLKLTGNRNSSKTGYTFTSITPEEIEVTFDFIDTKEYNVVPKIVGAAAAEGLVAETPIINGLENGVVTIKGPRSTMEKIDTVAAFAQIDKTLESTQTYTADIKAYDKEGKEINASNLVFSTNTASVSVPISKKLTLPVKAAFNNLPEGLTADNIKHSIDHKAVTIVGTPEVVSKMTSAELSPIDLTLVSKASQTFESTLVLPDGARLLDNIEFFTVTIDTEDFEEKTLSVSNIKYSGLDSSLKANVSTDIKNVKICGNKNDIKNISSKDLYAVVDLSDKPAGDYTVSVIIKSDKYKNVWQVGQYNVAVSVK